MLSKLSIDYFILSALIYINNICKTHGFSIKEVPSGFEEGEGDGGILYQ